jgi:hypothetical protein
MQEDTRRDRKTYVRRMRAVAKASLSYEEECYLTMLPLRGVYLISSCGCTLVICPSQRNSIYIVLWFMGKLSFRSASHFPAP